MLDTLTLLLIYSWEKNKIRRRCLQLLSRHRPLATFELLVFFHYFLFYLFIYRFLLIFIAWWTSPPSGWYVDCLSLYWNDGGFSSLFIRFVSLLDYFSLINDVIIRNTGFFEFPSFDITISSYGCSLQVSAVSSFFSFGLPKRTLFWGLRQCQLLPKTCKSLSISLIGAFLMHNILIKK